MNAILTVICKLFKERHYISCTSNDEETSVEQTVKLLLVWVFRTHELSNSIVFDRNLQFIFIIWKFVCLRLSIRMKLFTNYYSQINNQTKRTNQNVKQYLRIFCFYMQNDWVIWLSMTEFVDNNVFSSIIEQSTFFLNKNFYSRMSFDSNSIEYEITRARIEANKAKNISKHMKKLLKRVKKALKKARVAMITQANKHRKDVIYKVDNMIFVNSRNMIMTKSFKKLNHKMKESFKVIVKIDEAYWLELSSTIKIYSKFSLNLLRLNFENSLEEQRNESFDSVIIENEDEWKVKNILNSRHYERSKRLQYCVNWKEYNVNLHWYNVYKSEFESCQKVVNNFHQKYLIKSR